MSPEPLVSVVIPTQNRPLMLMRAVASASNQTLGRIEIIVVDDGSDPPLERSSLPTDHRVRVIRNESRRGASAARNSGWRSSRANYVAFLDDDDEWLPGKLAAQVGVLDSEPDVVLVSCAFRVVSDITGKQIRFAQPPFDDGLSFSSRINSLSDIRSSRSKGSASVDRGLRRGARGRTGSRPLDPAACARRIQFHDGDGCHQAQS